MKLRTIICVVVVLFLFGLAQADNLQSIRNLGPSESVIELVKLVVKKVLPYLIGALALLAFVTVCFRKFKNSIFRSDR